MPKTENKPFVDTGAIFDDQDGHYVCCAIPEGELAITKTLCGKEIALEVSEWDEDGVSCEKCTVLQEFCGCPLGFQCPLDYE